MATATFTPGKAHQFPWVFLQLALSRRFQRDGKADLAVAMVSETPSASSLQGDGAFRPAQAPDPCGHGPSRGLGDFNSDGELMLAS